jgi:hypothetical protein
MARNLVAELPIDRGPALTQAILSQQPCSDCGEHQAEHDNHGLEMGQRCHEGAGFAVVYQGGVLYFFCRVCEAFVVHVAVATGANPGAH